MITQQRIKQLFTLDYETGHLIRKIDIGCGGFGCQKGDIVGTIKKNGYIRVRVDNKTYPRSHLVWLYVNGSLPRETIDHINRNRADDRPVNLREVVNADNYKNMKKFSTNKSGHTGVSWHKKSEKWMAVIVVDYKQKYLGLFTTIEKAVEAREKANLFYGFDPSHGKESINTHLIGDLL